MLQLSMCYCTCSKNGAAVAVITVAEVVVIIVAAVEVVNDAAFTQLLSILLQLQLSMMLQL